MVLNVESPKNDAFSKKVHSILWVWIWLNMTTGTFWGQTFWGRNENEWQSLTNNVQETVPL